MNKLTLCVAAIVAGSVAPTRGETPLGTSFTYQGQLKQAGAPLSGTADFQFTLWDAAGSGNPPVGGGQVGSLQAVNAQSVSAGLFTVTLNAGGAFGGNAFNGNARWLQIAVRSPAGGGSFTTLAPRQPLTATPQALVALSVPGAVSGSGATNSIPLWSGGTTLGNSAITQSANGVQMPNGVQLAAGAQGNHVTFGSPNGETGMTIEGVTGRADVRFDGATLRLLAGPAGGPPSNGIAINSNGVQMPNGVQLAAGAQGNRVAFGSPSGETGMVIEGAGGRADLRFNGTLKLVNGPGGTPPATNGIAIDTSGNVGMGTTTPEHRLSIIGGPDWTSFLWKGALELANASAIGWQHNAAGNRFGIGQSTGGLYFFSTLSDPGTTGSPPNYVLEITDAGNLVQPINNNGLVKAMMVVEPFFGDDTFDPIVTRCFNGITNSSVGNCGFTLSRPLTGVTRIDFGFDVSNRFVSVTPEFDSLFNGGSNAGANYRFLNNTTIEVFTFQSGDSNGLKYANFTLIMY